jgi:Flp pilus assembly protein TadG
MAPAMVVLLGLTALVVDLGNGRQKRRQIQSTADAASHAGA